MKNTIELKYKLYLTTYPQYKLFQHVIFLLHTITIFVFQLTSPNSYKAKYYMYFHIFSEWKTIIYIYMYHIFLFHSPFQIFRLTW